MNSMDVISKALLPFAGGLKRFTPWLLKAVSGELPMSEWSKWSYHDMTCGSCAGSAAFAFYGMSVTANDLSLRSYLSAKAIFGRQLSVSMLIADVIQGHHRLPTGRKPATELVPDFLHPIAATIFDKLFFASEQWGMSAAEDSLFRYLAIRWVLLNKNFTYFLKLPTQDLRQLSVQGPQWAKVVKLLENPLAAVLGVAHDIDQLTHAILSAKPAVNPVVMIGDCRKNIEKIEFDRPAIVCLNPPTTGNATFMQSNRVLDTLLFGEQQPQSDDEMPAELWKSCVYDSAVKVPVGSYVISFAGDGPVTWQQAHDEVFDKIGPTLTEWTFPWGDNQTAGLILLRRE